MKLARLYQGLFRGWTAVPRALGLTCSPFPLEVSVSITHRCNLDCSFCLARPLLNRGEEELTTAEWLRFLRSTPRPSLCVFAGGEPFVREDFLEILADTMRRRRCVVVTNGTVVPDEFPRLAVEGGLMLVSYSLDGIGAVHDRLRRGPGAFDAAVRSIEALQRRKRSRRPLLSLSAVLLPGNLDALVDLADLAEDLGADFLTFGLHSPPLRCLASLDDPALDQPAPVLRYDLPVLREQLHRLAAQRRRVEIRFLPVFRSAESLLAYLEREGELPLNEVFEACGAPWGSVFVTPSGEMYPCRVFHPVGNVRERSFARIWNGPAMRRFRARLLAEGVFPSCVRCCRLREG